MNNEQRLYPLRIYQINRVLEEFKWVCGIGEDQLINFGVLDYKNRNFNWTVVHNDRWSFDDDIIRNIKKNEKSLKDFLKKVEDKNKDFDIIKESVKEIRNILPKKGGNNELHYHLLNLYHFYPHKSDLFADGIIYRNFINRSKRLLYATGELLIEKKECGLKEEENIPYSLYPWIDMTFVYDGGDKVRSFSCQEDKKDIEYTQANRDKKLREASKFSSQFEPDNVYFKYLTPLFTGYKASNTKEPYKVDEDSLKQSITAFKYMLYIPVYDVSIGGQLFGNFCGNISIPFAFEKDMKEFKYRYIDRILENAYLLMRATTPLHEILKQRMEERDLLEHFVKYITMVQDWERVMVLKKKEDDDIEVQYCYQRNKHHKSNPAENPESWGKCRDFKNGCLQQDCKQEYYEKFKKWFIKAQNRHHLPINEVDFGNKLTHSKHKLSLDIIFTKKFIPELVDEIRYSDIALVFEYPPYTIFPPDESTTHKVGISYERQHIEILRQMYSQEERIRHATQIAITAIIARNHSHHIGSHVIPRTSVALLKERLKNLQNKGKLNGNCDFIKIIDILKTRLDEYIQKKADFMAEVATEPLISTKNIAFLREIIRFFATNTLIMDNLCDSEGLNYPKGDCNYDNYGCSLKIKPMHNGKDLDANFTCPSCREDRKFKLSDYPYTATCGEHSKSNGRFYGELQWGGQIKNDHDSFNDFEIAVPGPLGEYALYCFLENFIRNSAKHNRDVLQNGLNIHINVSEIEDADIKSSNGFFKEEDKDEFCKVELWDNATNPDKEVTSEDGKKKPLVEFLNEKIQQSIINDDLSIRKGAWGIAEMKIMATLLKGSDNFVRMAENLKVVKLNKNGKDRLVYTFKMMRPRKVAFLVSHPPVGYNNHKKEGIWWFKSHEEFKDHIQNGKSIAAFEFVVIDSHIAKTIKTEKNENNNDFRKFLALLPFRVLIEGNSSSIKGAMSVNNGFINDLKKDTSGIYQAVWKEWIERVKNLVNIKNNLLLFVFLYQDKALPPTKEWIDYQHKMNIKLIACAKDNWDDIKCKIQNDDKKMVYDRHFSAYRNALKKYGNSIIFHEIIEKNSSDFIHIFSTPEAETIYGMVEASLLNVLIMDERVAERVYDKIITGDEEDSNNAYVLYGSGKRIHTAKKAGIFICTHIDKGNGKEEPIHENLNSKFPRIVVKLNNRKCFEEIYWKENENGNNEKKLDPHLLIIHQGIMEDFLKISDISEFMEFIDNLRESIPFIVIDSGRGIPPGLPSTEKFIPFSLLEDWVMKERISKYSLVRFLMRLNRRRAL